MKGGIVMIMSIKCIFLLLLVTFILTACSQKPDNKTAYLNNQDTDNNSTTTAPEQQSDHNSLIMEIQPAAADYTKMFGKLDKLPEGNDFGYDIRSTDLSDCDLSNEYSKLLQTTFDSKTVWPDSLPEDFKPNEIMDLYKNPGLGIRTLHEKGITGKGIGLAIIDQPLLVDHSEYKDRLKYYSERESVTYQEASMHGPAVTSIAVGKDIGVAPEADLYYIADDFHIIKDDYSLLAESINELLDLNKTIPNENRIRVISISWGYDTKEAAGSEELKKAYQRAEDENVFVITTSLYAREDMEFFGLDKYPLSDPDDFNSYTKIFYGNDKSTYNIAVPMNYRCTASPTGTEDYVVYREGGKSWATPYVAGLYVLACQVKPDITPQEFWELAASTARIGSGTYEGDEYKTPFIVDPVAIMDKLKKE